MWAYRPGRGARRRRLHPHVGVAREHGARDVPGDAHDHLVAGARLGAAPVIPANGHGATRAAAGGNLAPVLPLGGAVAPAAPTCANVGQFWRTNCRQHGLVFIGRDPAGALRVTAQGP